MFPADQFTTQSLAVQVLLAYSLHDVRGCAWVCDRCLQSSLEHLPWRPLINSSQIKMVTRMFLFSNFHESRVKETILALTVVIHLETETWALGDAQRSVRLWEQEDFLENIGPELTPSGLLGVILVGERRGNWGRDNLRRGLKHAWRAQEWHPPAFSGMKKTAKCPHLPGYSTTEVSCKDLIQKSICSQVLSPSKKNYYPFLWVKRCVFLHLWMFNLPSQAISFMLLKPLRFKASTLACRRLPGTSCPSRVTDSYKGPSFKHSFSRNLISCLSIWDGRKPGQKFLFSLPPFLLPFLLLLVVSPASYFEIP